MKSANVATGHERIAQTCLKEISQNSRRSTGKTQETTVDFLSRWTAEI